MASPSLLLPFCQYLLHRLQTDSLELFSRAVSEFLTAPQCLETVDTMVRLAFPLVAIVPIDNPDADERALADAILMRTRQHHASMNHRHACREFAELRAALAAKVELKNWDWLESIFAEFCVGDDDCLRDFVAFQRQAIAVVPLRSAEPFRVHPQSPTSAHSTVVASERKRQSNAARYPLKSPSKKPAHCKKQTKITTTERMAVLSAMLAIEKQRPWEKVFDVANITYPFDATEHADLAADLKTFWERHARTVWERKFWFQYGSPQYQISRQRDRKIRQDVATRFFEKHVIGQAFETLGPEFFVDLDLQPEKHYWWWYRGPVIDMLRLGSEQCIEYMRTRAFARFPDPPPELEFANHKHNPDKSSMWAPLAKFQGYHNAMRKVKKARLAKRAWL